MSWRPEGAAGPRQSAALGAGSCDITVRIPGSRGIPVWAPSWSHRWNSFGGASSSCWRTSTIRTAPEIRCRLSDLKNCNLDTMSSPPSDNITSREANRSDNDIKEFQLPEDRNQIEMDTVEDLRRKLHSLEKRNLELHNQHNQEVSHYEKEIMKLRLELERAEVLHRHLESEMSFAKKEAHIQMSSAENELWDVKSKVLELQVLNNEYQQKAEAEKMVQSTQRQWEEEQQRLAVERDNIHRVHLAELEFLFKEKTETEKASQKTNAALQSMVKKFKDMEVEHHGCSKMLSLQADRLYFKDKWQETLIKELE
ncbi:hypothetical protein DV515_00013566, partial [Chloebia gouldiae]